MIRQRLKDIDIKITELADYLQITRPTLYKFIVCYDSNDKDSINKKVEKLFDYIEQNPLAGKKTVINYILNNLVEEKELGDFDSITKYTKVKKLMLTEPNSNKAKLINILATKNTLNKAVDYLIIVDSLIKKRKHNCKEVEILKPYNDLLRAIEKENK